MRTEPFRPLDPSAYREIVRRALAEDIGWGDVTTEAMVEPDLKARGTIVSRDGCVVAGVDVATEAFRQLDPGLDVDVLVPDGRTCAPGGTVMTVTAAAAALLTAERTALSFLERLSGVATVTRRFVEAAGPRCTILDTRRTTPLMRALERYAVRAGGGRNHRAALDDGVLLRRIHLSIGGGIPEALGRMRRAGHDLPIQVEVASPDAARAAIEAGAVRLLASAGTATEALQSIARLARGRAQLEVEGAATPEEVSELAAAGAEFVAIAALTDEQVSARMSLDIEPVRDAACGHA